MKEGARKNCLAEARKLLLFSIVWNSAADEDDPPRSRRRGEAGSGASNAGMRFRTERIRLAMVPKDSALQERSSALLSGRVEDFTGGFYYCVAVAISPCSVRFAIVCDGKLVYTFRPHFLGKWLAENHIAHSNVCRLLRLHNPNTGDTDVPRQD